MQNFALGEVIFIAFPFIHEYFFPLSSVLILILFVGMDFTLVIC